MILFHRRKERTLSYAIFMKIIISFSYITCIFFNLHRNTNTCIFIPAQFTLYVHFSFYLFDYRPVTAHSDNLGRCRTLQLVVVREPVVFPRGVDCLPQSQVHASGQQKRRLSDPLYKEMQTRMWVIAHSRQKLTPFIYLMIDDSSEFLHKFIQHSIRNFGEINCRNLLK